MAAQVISGYVNPNPDEKGAGNHMDLFVQCGNENCNSRVLRRIAIRSIGNRAYCTNRCLRDVNGQQYNARVIRVSR